MNNIFAKMATGCIFFNSAGALLRATARGALVASLCLAACANIDDVSETGNTVSAVTVQSGVDYAWARPS